MSTDKKKQDHARKIWADGKLIDWKDATVHVLTHGLHYGTGVFEGVRAYDTSEGPAIFRLEDHTRRLLNSAKIIGMPTPFSFQELCDAQLQLITANKMENAYIRPVMFYDDASLGLSVDSNKVRTFIAAMQWGTYLGSDALENGIRVGISSYRRHNPGISMCRAKVNGNYVNSVLANQEAKANGFDEALLLDTEGFVSEGAGENIFVAKDGKLYTPELGCALDGITMQSVLALACERGIEVIQRRITRDELYAVDEAFFTGTAAEVTPICSIDHRKIGDGKRGPITKVLQEAYFACVHGKDPKHTDWLAYVNQAVSETAVA